MLLGAQDPAQQSSPLANFLEQQRLARAQEEAEEDRKKQFALDIAKTIFGSATGGASAGAAIAAL
jgi:hypothetical protein